MLLRFVFLLRRAEFRLLRVFHLRSHVDSRVGTRALLPFSSISRNGLFSSDGCSSVRGYWTANFEAPLCGGPSSNRPEVRYVSCSRGIGEGVVFGSSRGCAVWDDATWRLRIGIGMLKSAASRGVVFPRRRCWRPRRLAKRGRGRRRGVAPIVERLALVSEPACKPGLACRVPRLRRGRWEMGDGRREMQERRASRRRRRRAWMWCVIINN